MALRVPYVSCTLPAQMLELARQGAVWLREYEGWGEGASAPVVEEGQEPPEMLRHLEHQISDAREVGFFFFLFFSLVFEKEGDGVKDTRRGNRGVVPRVIQITV